MFWMEWDWVILKFDGIFDFIHGNMMLLVERYIKRGFYKLETLFLN